MIKIMLNQTYYPYFFVEKQLKIEDTTTTSILDMTCYSANPVDRSRRRRFRFMQENECNERPIKVANIHNPKNRSTKRPCQEKSISSFFNSYKCMIFRSGSLLGDAC